MNKKEPSWLSARIAALIAARDAAVKLAADRLEQMTADRKQYLDLRDGRLDLKPFAYYNPSTDKLTFNPHDRPMGSQVWLLFRKGETP
jgi:hypothetical protein